MPIATIMILEGRTDQQRRALMRSVTDAIAVALDARPESIRVIIQDIPRKDWSVAGRSMEELGQ